MKRWCVVCVACVACGCSPDRLPPVGGGGLFEPGAADPFAPVTVELSPLTRVEVGPRGSPVLAVYLRLVDAWGHGTKAPAAFNVQLFRVSGSAGLAEREDGWLWEIDLRDPDENSGWFDATGLYRLPLGDVPAWVLEPDGGGDVFRVTVVVRAVGPDGSEIEPRDTLDKVVTPWEGG